MTAHSLPFSAAELVQTSATAAARRPRLLTLLERLALAFSLDGAALSVCAVFDRYARRMAGHALVFESLAERISHEVGDSHIDPDDRLYRQLEDLEAQLQQRADELQDLLRGMTIRPGGRRERMARSFEQASQSARAVAAAVRDLRGTIRAHDANVDAISKARDGAPVWLAATPADVDAMLGEVLRSE